MSILSGIKSIQRGTIALTGVATNTATLSPAVDVTKTELRLLGYTTTSSAINEACCHVVLTNSTTVTATKSAATNNNTVSWEITEFY